MSIARKALFVVNPVSGRGSHALLPSKCIEVMNADGLEVEVLETSGPGSVAEDVALHQGSDYQIIVAGGGDGTVREVAQVARKIDLPLGIVPLGTSNSVVRELGISLDPLQAASTVATGQNRIIDVGEANGALFLLCHSAGFDAEVVKRVHKKRHGGISMLRYLPAAMATFFSYELRSIEALVDGLEAPPGAVQIVICNARTYGGVMHLSPDATIDDGLLDVCLFYGSRWSLLGQALRVLIGRKLKLRASRHAGNGVLIIKAREIVIAGPPSLPVEIDGDIAANPPHTIKVIRAGLTVIVPAETKK
jgi:YegS/Rv2252/BmrU family lipid kinase